MLTGRLHTLTLATSALVRPPVAEVGQTLSRSHEEASTHQPGGDHGPGTTCSTKPARLVVWG